MQRLVLTSHSNTRCKGMFDSFITKQIRTNDARHDYSVFLARLSPATYETCSKIKHHWSKFETRRRNNEVGISFDGSSRFGDQRNNWLHKRLGFSNKRSDHLRLCPCRWGLGTDADIRREP